MTMMTTTMNLIKLIFLFIGERKEKYRRNQFSRKRRISIGKSSEYRSIVSSQGEFQLED